jgi:hypothetical protein
MGHHVAKEVQFEWIAPQGAGDVRQLSVDGNYVGSIALDGKPFRSTS